MVLSGVRAVMEDRPGVPEVIRDPGAGLEAHGHHQDSEGGSSRGSLKTRETSNLLGPTSRYKQQSSRI